MYRVHENTTIVTVTELRSRTSELMKRAHEGEIVVVQQDNKPRGVYLSYRNYLSMCGEIERLEIWELALVARQRRETVARGEMGTTSLAEMIAEFAPDLRDPAGD